MSPPSPWWSASRHGDRRPFLLARQRIKAGIRAWFEAQGFVEVDPGCLQTSPGNETHLHAFQTERVGTDLSRSPLYLHTSPEFAMKKLLAAGEEKIFTFSPVFRNRERGVLHAPEFTMLEWYRVGAPYERLWEDCAAILDCAAGIAERSTWTFRGRSADISALFAATTVDDAFREYAGVAIDETYGADSVDRAGLMARAKAIGITTAADDTWSDVFSRILVEKVEPRLGSGRAEILYEYPSVEAALARPSPRRAAVAERFELYVTGVELANGFGELTDAAEQRRRFEAEMAEKSRIYGERYPVDEEFLAALAAMPEASGCAMGFDRLVMLATGAPSVDHVIWTPLAEDR